MKTETITETWMHEYTYNPYDLDDLTAGDIIEREGGRIVKYHRNHSEPDRTWCSVVYVGDRRRIEAELDIYVRLNRAAVA